MSIIAWFGITVPAHKSVPVCLPTFVLFAVSFLIGLVPDLPRLSLELHLRLGNNEPTVRDLLLFVNRVVRRARIFFVFNNYSSCSLHMSLLTIVVDVLKIV